MRHISKPRKVSDYRIPKRTYVVWWMEGITLLVIALATTVLRGLRQSRAAA